MTVASWIFAVLVVCSLVTFCWYAISVVRIPAERRTHRRIYERPAAG
ncbi:MAG TPA: hypothetical protein VGP03_08755 [Pseudonocardiaceae bacterium]|jgi:hypothetical protein|nr:hypothetical protein [Pseudonocardiaceae bacterium]